MPKEKAGKRLRESLVGKIAATIIDLCCDEVLKVFRTP
jgi:hypothetical protein